MEQQLKMNLLSSISKKTGVKDWGSLRAEGITLIGLMNAWVEQWTDYNLPDPGITVLETLCYAITDLSYRLNYPVADLLAANPNGNGNIIQQFFSAQQALPNAPLTIADYRRLLLDLPEVNNAWVEAFETSGLYVVFVDSKEELSNEEQEDLREKILNDLNQQRNLAEAFFSVEFLEKGEIDLELSLVLTVTADSAKVLDQVNDALSAFFSPAVKKYTFKQLEERGMSVAEILQGPLPKNGFVLPDELEKTKAVFSQGSSVPTFIFKESDLLNCLKNVPGIREASLISWQETTDDPDNTDGTDTDEPTPELTIVGKAPQFHQAVINISQYGLDLGEQRITGQTLVSQEIPSAIDVDAPQGQYRYLNNYSTIQNQLPDYYGVGAAGLMPGAPALRQEQAKQLRGYLMLFDQTLCNYFAQLSHAAGLLAMRTNPEGRSAVQSYFSQKLPAVAWQAAFPDMYRDIAEQWAQPEVENKSFLFNAEHKNKLLDYLLALFSQEYIPLDIYQILCPDQEENTDRKEWWTRYLTDKQEYLNEIVLLIGKRGQQKALQRIIALKLAITEEDVVITDDALEKSLPIPYNPIPFLVATPQDSLQVEVFLPERFVAEPGQAATPVQEYAYKLLLALIPANICFTLLPLSEESAPETSSDAQQEESSGDENESD